MSKATDLARKTWDASAPPASTSPQRVTELVKDHGPKIDTVPFLPIAASTSSVEGQPDWKAISDNARNFEKEWLSQSKINDFRNWLVQELAAARAQSETVRSKGSCPTELVLKLCKDHRYVEVKRLKMESPTNAGGIQDQPGRKLTGVALHHPLEFAHKDINGVQVTPTEIILFVSEAEAATGTAETGVADCLREAIKECEEHNDEYHHRTPDEQIAKWKASLSPSTATKPEVTR